MRERERDVRRCLTLTGRVSNTRRISSFSESQTGEEWSQTWQVVSQESKKGRVQKSPKYVRTFLRKCLKCVRRVLVSQKFCRANEKNLKVIRSVSTGQEGSHSSKTQSQTCEGGIVLNRRAYLKVVRKSFTFTGKGLRHGKSLQYFRSGIKHEEVLQTERVSSMSKWVSNTLEESQTIKKGFYSCQKGSQICQEKIKMHLKEFQTVSDMSGRAQTSQDKFQVSQEGFEIHQEVSQSLRKSLKYVRKCFK